MIDKNKIAKAARKCLAAFRKANPDGYSSSIIDIESNCLKNFKDGAKWAINEFQMDLWHPASEEPNHESIRTYILGKTKASESGVLPMLLRPNTNWKEFVVSHGVTHWLYVDDLFPKKGGEQ